MAGDINAITQGAPVSKPRHRTRLEADARRAEILAAVRDICATEGVGRLSVSRITERAGCTRSLFYHYFPNWKAALDAALDCVIDGFVDELRTWNEHRVPGDIDGALDSCAALFKRLVLDEDRLPKSLSADANAALYTGFVHRVADRTARYICDSTVVDFARLHTVRINHVYETFYVLITGLIMFIRTHPDASEDTIKDIAASTLHIEKYTRGYAGLSLA